MISTLPAVLSGSRKSNSCRPVASPSRVALALIRGIDRVRDILYENTLRFAEGFPANNALLWGARGMGKSSLVKAIHAEISADRALATEAC